MQVAISGAFINSVLPSTSISELSHLCVRERRITDEFTNAQHPLNMDGDCNVSKLISQSVPCAL